MTSTRYVALFDGRPGAYGVAFPDAPGCAAMGTTREEALRNAAEALTEWQAFADTQGGRPTPRGVEELQADPEVAEQLAAGSELVEVEAA